jgi:hypothetical protein
MRKTSSAEEGSEDRIERRWQMLWVKTLKANVLNGYFLHLSALWSFFLSF